MHYKYLGECIVLSFCARIQYCTLADRFPFRTVRLECVIDAISLILHIPSFLRRLYTIECFQWSLLPTLFLVALHSALYSVLDRLESCR